MKKIIAFLLLCVLSVCVPLVCSAQELVLDYIEGDAYYKLKYGFLDEQGRVKIPYIYDYASGFSCGYALVTKGDKTYYIDKNNNPAFGSNKGKYTFFYDFAEDLCVAFDGKKYGYLDTNGKIALAFEYDDASNFSEGFACVKKGDKYGYIDKKGNVIVEFKYDDGESFTDGYARVVRNNGKYGFVNMAGEECVPAIYERASLFSEGKSCVKLNGKYTYVTQTGFICFNPVLEEAYPFINGTALIKVDGKYARICHDGYFSIKPKFDYLGEFVGEYAVAGRNVADEVIWYGFVDKGGSRITPMTYDSITYEGGVYTAVKGGDVVCFDEELNIIKK